MIVDQPMTIYTAAELKPRLVEAVAQDEVPELDLSGVTEIDSAGVQLLLLARREAQLLGRNLRVTSASEAVTEVLVLLGIDGLIAADSVTGDATGPEGAEA